MAELVRVRRWLLPAGGVSLALAGLCALVLLEVQGDRPDPVHLAVHAPPPPQAGAATGGGAPRERSRAAAAGPRTPRAASRRAWAQGRAAAAPRQAQVSEAGPEELSGCATLAQRLERLDEAVAGLPEDEAADALRDFLEGPLPGDEYEARMLRLGILARLGRLPGRQAEAVLVERLDPERPRPERLLALDMLAQRFPAGAGEITAVAQFDHDQVVRAKARRTLERRGGS